MKEDITSEDFRKNYIPPGLMIHSNKLSTSACRVVKTAYEYFLKEKEEGGFLMDPAKLVQRTEMASGKNRTSIRRIVLEKESTSKFITPLKKNGRKKATEKTSILAKHLLRQKVYQFYREGRRPVYHDVYKELHDEGVVEAISQSTSKTHLKKLGFISKCYAGRNILFEKQDVIVKRSMLYKSTINLNYDDVVWIGEACFKPPPRTCAQSKSYLIILQVAGTKKGFIKKTISLTYNLQIDFQRQITHDYFKRWLEKLLDIAPSGCKFILNSTYSHNALAEKIPNVYSDKDTIKSWLNKYNIPYTDELLKPELLNLVKLAKPVIPTYSLDSFVADKGFGLIRLPPYHEHFNAVEYIFEKIKTHFEKLRSKHTSFSCPIESLEKMISSSIDTITSKDWEDAVKKASEAIENARNYERTLEDSIQNLIHIINEARKSGRGDLTTNKWFQEITDESEMSDESEYGVEDLNEKDI